MVHDRIHWDGLLSQRQSGWRLPETTGCNESMCWLWLDGVGSVGIQEVVCHAVKTARSMVKHLYRFNACPCGIELTERQNQVSALQRLRVSIARQE
jgi:hypothetical protein